MELDYSPRHTACGSMHMLSPTHPHSPQLDGFATIRQIRRSLSRSPSKPSRYTILTTKGDPTSFSVPGTSAPRSPSGLSRGISADSAGLERPKTSGPRCGPLRMRSRRTSPNSPLRRALSDNTNHANALPRYSTRRSSTETNDQENMDCSEDSLNGASECGFPSIKIDFAKPGPEKLLQPVLREHASPVKSSPLKRSDGVMNLEAASLGSPRSSKRRSLHGASIGADHSVFDHGFDGARDSSDSSDEKENERDIGPVFNWSGPAPQSPQRRPFSLRKSTLQQRTGPAARRNLFSDAMRDSTMSPSSARARSRISLDGALPLRSPDFESPFRRGNANEPPVLFQPPVQKQYQSAPKPHPLSHALTPSSSFSSAVGDDEEPTIAIPAEKPLQQERAQQTMEPPRRLPGFSKSLPLGALRPRHVELSVNGPESYATPDGFKMAKPLPQAFMSTGLISKRNRDMDGPQGSLYSSTHMPDTPSKKAPLIHIGPLPASALGKVPQPMHEFGSPSTPFNGKVSKICSESFGQGVSIFGSKVNQPQLTRRNSFLSIDDGDDMSDSPTKHLDAQTSADDLPPTPTKSASTTIRPNSKGGKSNSLRSSLFGRRTSIGPDTFASPANREHSPPPPADEDDSPIASPITIRRSDGKTTPLTPQESFTPPDPSNLSISVEHRVSLPFNSSSFPPATPTGPRDSFGVSIGQSNASSGYFGNDVDTALTTRFGHVQPFGVGEFSQVYKVQTPLAGGPSALRQKLSPGNKVWAVKKSRKPYTGVKDRQRKMQEVQILKALQGHEHILELVDDWEAKNHLYIQTEYCENGNLKDFLQQTGFKGRLDDFRIWKILLELAQGVKSIHDANYIHLDLKPANVFIDWEGVLKIGDFGMASEWPAPAGLDGEGDREYIGPEVLSGRFDKPADIFSLGMIMLEIAGNIVLPDNGASWQRLRTGDLSDLPSLTWSSDSTLVRDPSGDPVELLNESSDSLCASHQGDNDDNDLSFLRPSAATAFNLLDKPSRSQDLSQPPNFMVRSDDPEALDKIVQWMIRPNPDERPTVDQLLSAGGVQWVDQRRRAGATVYEGNWGPADDVLNHGMELGLGLGVGEDVEMLDI